jgi:hypothetical protein
VRFESRCNGVNTYPTRFFYFVDPLVRFAAVRRGSKVIDGGLDGGHCKRVYALREYRAEEVVPL